MQAGLSTKNAPSPSVVLPHFAYGAIAFIAAAILMFFSADDLSINTLTPKILSLVHVLVLGWITMIIFGALYQLIPVVMEVKLHSEILGLASFGLLGLGTPMMAYSFYVDFIASTYIMMIGGSFVLLSVILFMINTLASAAKTEVKSVENRFIVSSIFWLLFTVVLGLVIILFPQILAYESFKIHVHLGIVGWFMMLVVGVASTLMPMFFIAHQLNKKFLEYAYWAITVGLILLTVSMFFKLPNWVSVLSAISIVVGFGLFIRYNYAAYKKRLRKKLDIGMKLSVLAFVLLFMTLLSGFLSSFGNQFGLTLMTKFNAVYGISLIYGFLSALILGQMYKTLPFIVWLKMYQDKVGKFKTPLPADMHSNKVAAGHYYSFLVGFILLIVGVVISCVIVIKISALFMLITALLYAYNTFKIIYHKEKLEPLVFAKAKK